MIEQKKTVLKPCRTVITRSDGRKFELSSGECKEIESGVPFVVDTKPDMLVAEIAPGVFLSSQDPPSSLEVLEKYNINHILSLGIEPSVKFENLTYDFVDLMDLPESDILQAVKTCLEIIELHKSKNILVHCNAGVSRSATIVIAYLMSKDKISYEEAYEKVKQIRPCIKPNEGFARQLKHMKFY